MSRVVDTIPESVAAEAEAARAWFSETRGSEFKVTGFVDPEEDPEGASDGRELQLILCGGQDGHEACLRERFKVEPSSEGFAVTHLEDTPPEGSPAPLLDPPPGTREGWLDSVVADHKFVVILFYRGFW